MGSPPRAIPAFALAASLVVLGATLAQAEITQQGDLRVAFDGKLTPHALPRSGAAPVVVAVGGQIATTDGTDPPQLQHLTIAINRHGRLDARGLPTCTIKAIQPSTSAAALRACGHALVGEGSFSANVVLPGQSPFPSQGRVLAFNGRLKGRPAILAHVYGTHPVPTSYVLPFAIGRARGAFGTTLSASLPRTTGDWGFVTGIQLTLHRRFSFRGATHSYISAGCPAPRGFKSAFFPLARASFAFPEQTLTSTLTRSCGVRG